MLILWPLLQPPWCRACLGLSLLKTCANLLKSRKRWSKFIKLEWDLARWILSCYSLRRISCLRGNSRLTKCEERLLGFGYSRTKSCRSAFFLGHICYAYTVRHQSYFWRSYMKEFVEVTQEANPYLTKPSLKDIGGRTFKRKHKST